MKIKKKLFFWLGILILVVLGVSYFVNINVDTGGNYKVISPLLGVLIFYKVYILILYILIALGFIFIGLKKKKKNS